MTAYLDASASVKLLAHEPESAALTTFLDEAARDDESVVSSMILETELRRTAARLGFPQILVTAILDGFDLLELTRSMCAEAGLLAGTTLRSLDALHVISALRVQADVFVSYDARQIEAAREAGLRIASPA